MVHTVPWGNFDKRDVYSAVRELCHINRFMYARACVTSKHACPYPAWPNPNLVKDWESLLVQSDTPADQFQRGQSISRVSTDRRPDISHTPWRDYVLYIFLVSKVITNDVRKLIQHVKHYFWIFCVESSMLCCSSAVGICCVLAVEHGVYRVWCGITIEFSEEIFMCTNYPPLECFFYCKMNKHGHVSATSDVAMLRHVRQVWYH